MNSSDSANIYIYLDGGHIDTWEGKGNPPPEDVTNVTFHQNVTSIGEGAFGDCTSLVKIEIPPTVTTIGNDAFFECISLSDITLPSTLTSIGVGAFSCCESLETIRLPSSITRIESYAFCECTSLRSVLGPTSSNSSFHNFYSLLATTDCDSHFIGLAIELHPQQLKEVDENGNFPLHIAASSSALSNSEKTKIIKELLDAYPEAAKLPNNEGNLPLHIRSNSTGDVEDINMLLAAYPEAAKLPNKYGKLPLFMALASGKKWGDGVEELLNAFPAVTIQTDTETNMFPFMTAASEEAGSCLDSIYSLLRTRPEMNKFYHAKANTENQVGSDCHKEEGTLHSSKRQRLE